ncbi:hypothetical protein ASG67_17855 [Sphingomonas sp. Leaf339]|uniref:IS5 family transposase n=1 Tax=Sphingomonas sp. Leaf339 TaxID=1736343 RepID=UPI0006F928AD|nr:IS5 family transposase [Sphingomonas sp. Leaf339]KQU54089.1 hypothetical protein ASG67_17855 [Sphingomonas sp. Leaf339]
MALIWSSDDAWALIEPHLSRKQSWTRRMYEWQVISGIMHVLKGACPWFSCPADYGSSTTVYNRVNRESRRGFWLTLLISTES